MQFISGERADENAMPNCVRAGVKSPNLNPGTSLGTVEKQSPEPTEETERISGANQIGRNDGIPNGEKRQTGDMDGNGSHTAGRRSVRFRFAPSP